MAAEPKITLYTNHACPWAHRAHITIKELGLKYEEVIIDLNSPRPQWYLDINPRGLVPSLNYNGQIITESAVVAQFLADAHPSHLVPNTGTVDGALKRARINFFVDTWFSKVGGAWFQIAIKNSEDTKEERDKLVKDFLATVEKEIEPLLADAKPFFGGEEKVGLAEALTAPFILRIYSYTRNGLLPQELIDGLDALPNFKKWAAEVIKQESVTYVWDEAKMIPATKTRFEKLRAAAAAK
ncbi:glutathione-S-transferas-like protein omega 1 [Periconia macrospinosa]|uniref:Glutathione-S-transferas-like protein omega 1 n=1 Tax=Periconia macrospinosa TaxID=97972 RepID=A0A2V1DLB8_9PLEO|nr:glutathione-S-transferas-like protein omega 1 [Periconia macrospinosa]